MKEAPCPDCEKELTYQALEYMDGSLYIEELYYCAACEVVFDPEEIEAVYG